MVVEIGLGCDDAKTFGKHGGGKILRARFAIAARDGDDFEREAAAVGSGNSLERLQRIGGADEGEIRHHFRRQLLDHSTDRPARRRIGEEFVTVEFFPAQRHEQLAARNRARVGRDAGDGRGRAAWKQLAGAPLRDCMEAYRVHLLGEKVGANRLVARWLSCACFKSDDSRRKRKMRSGAKTRLSNGVDFLWILSFMDFSGTVRRREFGRGRVAPRRRRQRARCGRRIPAWSRGLCPR